MYPRMRPLMRSSRIRLLGDNKTIAMAAELESQSESGRPQSDPKKSTLPRCYVKEDPGAVRAPANVSKRLHFMRIEIDKL
jgi:hypothetical protein